MNKEFKITLEAARVNAKLSQKEAAKRLSINPATLGKYESGITYPTIEMIKKMEELYSVSKDNIKW